MKTQILLLFVCTFFYKSLAKDEECRTDGSSEHNRQPSDNVNGAAKYMFEAFSIETKAKLVDFEVRVHQKSDEAREAGILCYKYSSTAGKSSLPEARCSRPIKGSFIQFYAGGKGINNLCSFWAIGGPPCPKGSKYTWGGECVSDCKDVIKGEKMINGGKVMNYAKCGEHYAIKSREDAAAVCKRNGLQFASADTLREAHRIGLNVCTCGWLSDGSVKWPNYNDKSSSCGPVNKINNCPANKMGIWGKPTGKGGWNVFCIKKTVCDDVIKAEKAITGGTVINYAKCGHYYSIKTKAEAAAVCQRNNAVLATPAQLTEAFNNKMSVCRCGWLSDGSVRYPNNFDKRGHCGAWKKINVCPPDQMGKWGEPTGRGGWNTLCFKKAVCDDKAKASTKITGGNVVNYAKCGDYYAIKSKAEAAAVCVKNGGVLATPAQLTEAFNNKMNVCECGWLSDGSVRYPNNYRRNGCGAGNKIKNCPSEEMGKWGAPKSKGGWNVLCFIKQ